MVADAVGGVALDVVPTEIAEAGPGVEEAGPPGHHGGDGVRRSAGGPAEGVLQGGESIDGFGVEHRAGRPGGREGDGMCSLMRPSVRTPGPSRLTGGDRQD